MSWWHRAQASDSMKNFAGILRLPATCAELGKNIPLAPSPSSSMESGALEEFRMMYCLLHDCRVYHEPALTPTATMRKAAANPQVERAGAALRFCIHHAASITTARTQITMWAS